MAESRGSDMDPNSPDHNSAPPVEVVPGVKVSGSSTNSATGGRSFLGIELAPLSVPIERRLQTAALLLYEFVFFALPSVFTLLWLLLLLTPLFWVSIGYATWAIYDIYVQKTSSRGGRRWPWLREMRLWHYIRDYFPVSLEKTAGLDPNKNYLLGYHPHGAIGFGAVINFASNATGFQEKFPGVTPYLLTLKSNFQLPVQRGFLLWNGICDVSKDSIQWILTRQGKGNAAIIVIGGAEEALEARPGHYNITLRNRKGFVKQAIRAGACLVPMFSFGENELFNQVDNPQGSTLRYYQNKMKEMIGISPPIVYGRGIFNYSFGPLPFRHPVNTIVGRPIEVEQCDEPDIETINSVHQRYMDELSQLFDEHKTKYGVDPEKKLNYV